MMPSTSGTGADVSQFCIVTDTARHTKITIMGRALVPDVSVIDPRLLTTMPDAARRRHRPRRADARHRGVRLARPRPADRPPRAAGDRAGQRQPRPHDARARRRRRPRAMAQAALEAGLAFTNAILGATHAMSHQVGGMLDLPHGVVNGVLLPHVIRFNGARAARAVRPDRAGHGPGGRGGRARRGGRRAGGRGGARARRRGRRARAGSATSACATADIPRLPELTLGDACLTTNPRPTSVDGRHGAVQGGAVSGQPVRQDDRFPRTSAGGRAMTAAQWPRRGGPTRAPGGPTSRRSPACAPASRTTTRSTASPPSGCAA